MSEGPAEVRGIVVAHGAAAEGLVDAVRGIAGVSPDALVPISNEGLGRDALCEQIRGAFGEGQQILFTDLPSGSCHLAAMLVAQGRADVAVIAGVNLPMLLDFVFKRGLDLDVLVARLLDKGRSGIHGYRPLPG